MGQILDRLSRIFKSELSDASHSNFNVFEDGDMELKRIIDELKKEKVHQDSSKNENKYSKHKDNAHKANSEYQSSNSSQISIDDAFKVLGIDSSSSNEEIKSAYLKKMKEYHPDRVASLGKELVVLAEKKTSQINQAYSLIKKAKGIA